MPARAFSPSTRAAPARPSGPTPGSASTSAPTSPSRTRWRARSCTPASHNREFIERATTGFDEYAASVEPWTLERGELETGVPAEVIRDAAHAYARADRAIICWTLGITEHHNAVDNVFALINLALLTGHVGRYGSGLNPLRGQNNVQGGGDMGAIPNKLPGFQDIERDDEARAKFEKAWGTTIPPRYGWHLTQMFEAMDRGELRTLYVVGENPAQSEADAKHTKKLLEGLDHLVVQDIFLTRTAELADVVLPASASWCEAEGTVTNSERRVQRVRRALDPPGQARDDIEIVCEIAARMGHDLGPPDAESVWTELRSLSPMHAGMTYPRLEALGGIQWPCFDEEHPGELFLHGRLWESPISGPSGAVQRRRACASRRQALGRVPDPAHDRSAARLLQHRRPERRLPLAASPARVARPLARGLRAAGRRRRRAGQGDLAAGVGLRARPDRPDPAPGPGVHDAPLPRRGRDERAHDRRDRPQVGHGRVQGERDPGRPAHRRRAQRTRPCRSSRCRRSRWI